MTPSVNGGYDQGLDRVDGIATGRAVSGLHRPSGQRPSGSFSHPHIDRLGSLAID